MLCQIVYNTIRDTKSEYILNSIVNILFSLYDGLCLFVRWASSLCTMVDGLRPVYIFDPAHVRNLRPVYISDPAHVI